MVENQQYIYTSSNWLFISYKKNVVVRYHFDVFLVFVLMKMNLRATQLMVVPPQRYGARQILPADKPFAVALSLQYIRMGSNDPLSHCNYTREISPLPAIAVICFLNARLGDRATANSVSV